MPALPGALLVVAGAIAASWAFDFAEHGIATVGPVPRRPATPEPPDPTARRRAPLRPGGLRRLLVSFADKNVTARAFAGKRGEHVRASQELFVLSAATRRPA